MPGAVIIWSSVSMALVPEIDDVEALTIVMQAYTFRCLHEQIRTIKRLNDRIEELESQLEQLRSLKTREINSLALAFKYIEEDNKEPSDTNTQEN